MEIHIISIVKFDIATIIIIVIWTMSGQ